MQLWLSHEQMRQITHHAIAGAPEEVCGLIAGSGFRAQRVLPIENVAENPEHHFYMEERALLKAHKSIASANQHLIGIYHSHPQSEPIPSITDIQQAHYPDAAYLIVSLKHEKPRIQAWHIHNGQVAPVEIHSGNQAPDQHIEHKLSKAQKNAIIISAVITLLLMLVISFSLLPPAPDLSSIVGG